MRHALAIEAAILLGGPCLLIAPRLEVGLGAVSKEDLPCGFKVGAGLVERQGLGRPLSWALFLRFQTGTMIPCHSFLSLNATSRHVRQCL